MRDPYDELGGSSGMGMSCGAQLPPPMPLPARERPPRLPKLVSILLHVKLLELLSARRSRLVKPAAAAMAAPAAAFAAACPAAARPAFSKDASIDICCSEERTWRRVAGSRWLLIGGGGGGGGGGGAAMCPAPADKDRGREGGQAPAAPVGEPINAAVGGKIEVTAERSLSGLASTAIGEGMSCESCPTKLANADPFN